MAKRRRKYGCGSCFHRIDAHHAHSPECAGPCPTGSVPASHPIDLIHDLEDDTLVHNDQELPDDLPALLSTNNSTTAENDSSTSQRMDVDDDDLCGMFIADCNTPSSSHIPCESLQLCHDCMAMVLSTLRPLQENPPLEWLQFGDEPPVQKELVIQVCFMMGDQKSHDNIVGRKLNNSGWAGRSHRGCMCSGPSSSDPCLRCQPVPA
jgi:hypothetical protein